MSYPTFKQLELYLGLIRSWWGGVPCRKISYSNVHLHIKEITVVYSLDVGTVKAFYKLTSREMIGMHISIGTMLLNVRIVVKFEMLLPLLWAQRFPNCLFLLKLLDGRWSQWFSRVFVMRLPSNVIAGGFELLLTTCWYWHFNSNVGNSLL